MEEGMDEHSVLYTHNMRGDRTDEWVQEFRDNEAYRQVTRVDSTKLFHEILSWSPKDAHLLDEAALLDLARTYIDMRAPNGMAVVVSHRDPDKHAHLHVCLSGITYREGKSLRLPAKDLTKLKLRFQAYEQERYHLSHSIADHGKRARAIIAEKEYQLKARTKSSSRKEELRTLLESQFQSTYSQAEFLDRLNTEGLAVYERAGRPYGVIDADGRRHRFTTMGIASERLAEYDRAKSRQSELSRMRSHGRGQSRADGYALQRTLKRPSHQGLRETNNK
jgi:hypothetical protein